MENSTEKPGERFRLLRQSLGFTQDEFADALHVKYHQVQNIEYGRHRITEEVFASIGRAMPELLPWVVYGGTTTQEQLNASSAKLCKLLVARINLGLAAKLPFLKPTDGDKKNL